MLLHFAPGSTLTAVARLPMSQKYEMSGTLEWQVTSAKLLVNETDGLCNQIWMPKKHCM